ncbi:hypothetical protein KI387_041534, partial [Taxus chinensis]
VYRNRSSRMSVYADVSIAYCQSVAVSTHSDGSKRIIPMEGGDSGWVVRDGWEKVSVATAGWPSNHFGYMRHHDSGEISIP